MNCFERKIRIYRAYLAFLCLCFVPVWVGCKKVPPKAGNFLVKVKVVDNEQQHFPNAIVKINDKKIGITNDFGTFLGSFKGKVGQVIRIKVVGPGEDNFMIVDNRLRIRKNKAGRFETIPVQIEAFLRTPDIEEKPPKEKKAYKLSISSNAPNTKLIVLREDKLLKTDKCGPGKPFFWSIVLKRDEAPIKTLKIVAELTDTTKKRFKKTKIVRFAKFSQKRKSAQMKFFFQKKPSKSLSSIRKRPPPGKKKRAKEKKQIKERRTPKRPKLRRNQRLVSLMASRGTRFFVLGENKRSLGKVVGGTLQLVMTIGSFQRIRAVLPSGERRERVVEITKGREALIVRFSKGGALCDLPTIEGQLQKRRRLSESEFQCLRGVSRQSKKYFLAQILLARGYCLKRKFSMGKGVLKEMYKNRATRYDPYKALYMGIAFGSCKSFNDSIRVLGFAERLSNRFSVSDRYRNKKALYLAMADVYERRYYLKRDVIDLTRGLKKMERYAQHLRSSERRSFKKAQAEIKRLKKKITQVGDLGD